MVNALIFLGAGASAPFGIPTMKEMVPAFEQYLDKLGHDAALKYNMITQYKTIRDVLDQTYGYVDLESVFSVIDAVANETKYSDLGFTAMYAISRLRGNMFNQPISSSEEQKTAKTLLEHFKKFVRARCTIDESKADLIDEVYRNFFDVLGEKYGVGLNQAPNGKQYRTAGDWQIYTTNYDTCIESFWEGVADINDLFDENRGLKILGVNNVKITNKIKVVKLHGSIDWYKLSLWRIVKSSSARVKVGKEMVQAEQMLYPVQQKDLYLYPWLSLIAGFKDDLQRLRNWIVIGYSFNDEFILNIFKEFLSADPNYNLILLDPNAYQIAQSKFKEFPTKVKSIARNFADATSTRVITQVLV